MSTLRTMKMTYIVLILKKHNESLLMYFEQKNWSNSVKTLDLNLCNRSLC